MVSDNRLLLDIPKLAFDSGVYQERDGRIPETAPFLLKYDPVERLIVQELNDDIRSALKSYYEVGGYGSTPLGEGEFGKRQGLGIFTVIENCLKKCGREIGKTSFVEIGCSYGYLLYLLKEAGAAGVLGIEPGEEGLIASRKYNIPLIRDFFPTDQLDHKVGCIFSHFVLEHVEEPCDFLREMHASLEDGGMVFVAVPDSEKKMRIGDASIISHQHINYFTQFSLTEILNRAGFSSVEVQSSDQRSLLYGWGIKAKETDIAARASSRLRSADRDIFEDFRMHLTKNLQDIQARVRAYEEAHKTIGFYAPSGTLGSLIQFRRPPRIFNSDQVKWGKHISGLEATIENPEDLVTHPVDVLFVESIDYDREIRSFLSSKGIDQHAVIVSLKEIYEHNSGMKYAVGF